MKLSVVLEKKARFNIELPEEVAEQLFNRALGVILNEQASKYSRGNYAMARSLENLKAIRHKDIEASLKKEDCTEKIVCPEKIASPEKGTSTIPIVSEKEASTQNKVDIVKDPGAGGVRVSRKLVMLKCTGCNETLVGLVSEGQWTFTCKSCQTNNTLEELKPATYICPNCDYKAVFYVKDGLKTVKCKNCEGDIDLVFHEKKDRYLSANLIK